MLNNNTIYKIINITNADCYCKNIADIKITGVQWIAQKSVFEYPTSSTDLCTWQEKRNRLQMLLNLN